MSTPLAALTGMVPAPVLQSIHSLTGREEDPAN